MASSDNFGYFLMVKIKYLFILVVPKYVQQLHDCKKTEHSSHPLADGEKNISWYIYSRNYHLVIKGKYLLTKLNLDGIEKQQCE